MKRLIFSSVVAFSFGCGFSATSYAANKFSYKRAIEAARQLGLAVEDSSQAIFAEGARWQSQQP